MARGKSKPVPENLLPEFMRCIRELQIEGWTRRNGRRYPQRIAAPDSKLFLGYQRTGFIVETMIFRGLRFSELARMKVSDLDMRPNPPELHVDRSKRGASGRSPIPQQLASRLSHWRAQWQSATQCQSDLMFPNRNGKPISNAKFNRQLGQLAAALFPGTSITSHSFRDTCAVNLIQQDEVSIVDAARFLGHKSIRSTEVYIAKKQSAETRLELKSDALRNR